MRLTAQVVPARVDLGITLKVAVADRAVLAALQTHFIRSGGHAAVRTAAVGVRFAATKLLHSADALLAHARCALTLAVTNQAVVVAAAALAEPLTANALGLKTGLTRSALVVGLTGVAARGLLGDTTTTSAGLPISTITVGVAAVARILFLDAGASLASLASIAVAVALATSLIGDTHSVVARFIAPTVAVETTLAVVGDAAAMLASLSLTTVGACDARGAARLGGFTDPS